MGNTSWVHARLARDGRKARLTLEHIAHKEAAGPAAEHFTQFGPGAGGVGWDIWLHGLERHLADPAGAFDHEAGEAWVKTSEGESFVRAPGEAWGAAYAASGADPDEAREPGASTPSILARWPRSTDGWSSSGASGPRGSRHSRRRLRGESAPARSAVEAAGPRR